MSIFKLASLKSSVSEVLMIMTLFQIWKKMGLNNKRNYYRVTNMLAMQSIVSEAVNHKRSMMYRLRTISNATHGAPHVPANPEFCAPPSVVPPGMDGQSLLHCVLC
jgi:hypothetical protein